MHLFARANGVVLGTLHNNTDFLIPLELREALNLPHPVPTSPYFKRSREFQMYAKGLKKLEVPERFNVGKAGVRSLDEGLSFA